MEPLPGNSHRSKQEAGAEPKKIEQVVQGDVVKPSFFRRLRDTFIANRADTVGEFVIWDIFIPALKNTIADSGKSFIDNMFYDRRTGVMPSSIVGTMVNQSIGQYQNQQRTNYNSMGNQIPSGPSISRQGRAMHDFKEIGIPTRVQAEALIAQLLWHIENYNAVTVSDFYQMCGITPDYTDDKFGWTDISGTGILMRGSKYVIDLPRPIQLD
jgi:hypothetical protein